MSVRVIQGDCRKVVPTLGSFEFAFLDPPFGIDQPYDGYDDRAEYLDCLIPEAVGVCWDACAGVLVLHGPDDLVERYFEAARVFKMRRIAWVNWHYRFGQCGRSNWIDTRCHALVYAKHKTWTWNPDAVLVDSDSKTTYADKRIHETET